MIDILKIRKLQEEKIENDLKKNRDTQMSNLDEEHTKRKNDLELFNKAREEAETTIPNTLAAIEKRISDATMNGEISISYGITNSLTGTHLAFMIFNMLPLNGFVCEIRDNTITISW